MTVEKYFISQAKKAMLIEDFLRKELKIAGFSHAEIKKTPLGTRIIVYALRPGLVIGPGGENVKRLTRLIERKFKVENPHIEVEDVKNIYLDPNIVAWRIARAIERGGYFKRIAATMVERIIQTGARGVEIRLSGKLPSARAKTWKFKAGNLRKCGQEAVDQTLIAYEIALTKPGVVGIRVAIIPPEARFSDEIREKASVPIEVVEEEEGKEKVVRETTTEELKEEAKKEEETKEASKDIQQEVKEKEAEKIEQEGIEETPAEAEEQKASENKEEGKKE